MNDHAHFSGKYEVEHKFRVADLETFRRVLEKFGAEPHLIGNREIDLYMDTPEETLEKKSLTLVLRNMQPSERTLWIVKGPNRQDCVATRLPDFSKAREMLALMGYAPYLTIEKQRDMYFYQHFHITLDIVAPLGSFIEVATMSNDTDQLAKLERDVLAVAQQFGLRDADRVDQSYREMFESLMP